MFGGIKGIVREHFRKKIFLKGGVAGTVIVTG